MQGLEQACCRESDHLSAVDFPRPAFLPGPRPQKKSPHLSETQLVRHKDIHGEQCHILRCEALPWCRAQPGSSSQPSANGGAAEDGELCPAGDGHQPCLLVAQESQTPPGSVLGSRGEQIPRSHLHTKAEGKEKSWAPAQEALHVHASHESLFPAS